MSISSSLSVRVKPFLSSKSWKRHVVIEEFEDKREVLINPLSWISGCFLWLLDSFRRLVTCAVVILPSCLTQDGGVGLGTLPLCITANHQLPRATLQLLTNRQILQKTSFRLSQSINKQQTTYLGWFGVMTRLSTKQIAQDNLHKHSARQTRPTRVLLSVVSKWCDARHPRPSLLGKKRGPFQKLDQQERSFRANKRKMVYWQSLLLWNVTKLRSNIKWPLLQLQ